MRTLDEIQSDFENHDCLSAACGGPYDCPKHRGELVQELIDALRAELERVKKEGESLTRDCDIWAGVRDDLTKQKVDLMDDLAAARKRVEELEKELYLTKGFLGEEQCQNEKATARISELEAQVAQMREGLENAGEIICELKCGLQQSNHEIGKGIMELGMDENDLHLKNHGFINAALTPSSTWLSSKLAEAMDNKDGMLTVYILRNWSPEKQRSFALHIYGEPQMRKEMAEERAKVWEEIRARILTRANHAYCDYAEMTKRTECLGEEHKMKSGTFGPENLKALEKAHACLGAHFALHAVVKEQDDAKAKSEGEGA